MEPRETRKLIRNFLIEIFVYGLLLLAYFLIVLRSLSDWLINLYNNNLTIYAVVALVLIVVQGVALELATTFLIDRLGLERLE